MVLGDFRNCNSSADDACHRVVGEAIKGRFYEPEIQKVLKSDDERFDIDRLRRKRKRDGKTQYLVAWKAYPSKFDLWVDELVSK